MHGKLFLPLSASLVCFCLRTFFLKNLLDKLPWPWTFFILTMVFGAVDEPVAPRMMVYFKVLPTGIYDLILNNIGSHFLLPP